MTGFFSHHKTVKAIAALLLPCWLLGEVAHAAPLATEAFAARPSAAQPAAWPSVVADPLLLQTPSASVSIREAHAGTNGKLIIHIQDAHANPGAQKHLADALDFWMSRYPVDLVLSEGGEGDSELDRIRSADPAAWKRAAPQLLRDAVIAGEEYLRLVSDRPMTIHGIESEALYGANLETYRRLIHNRKDRARFIGRVRAALNALKERRYPEPLLRYEKARAEKPETGLSIRALTDLARGTGLEWGARYPALESLRQLMESEERIDHRLLDREVRKLSERLDAREQAALAADLKSGESARLARLAGANGSPAAFPEIGRYAEWADRVRSVDWSAALEEADRADDEIYGRLLGSEALQRLRALDVWIGLLEKAFSIQLTNREFKKLERLRGHFPSAGWQAWLNRELADAGLFDRVVADEPGIEAAISQASEFYDLVKQRDRVFLDRTVQALESRGADAAFLITGGYHTEHLAQMLRERGFSYVVAAPRVEAETDRGLYEKILLQRPARDTLRARMATPAILSARIKTIPNRPVYEALLESGAARLASATNDVLSPAEIKLIAAFLKLFRNQGLIGSRHVQAAVELLDERNPVPFLSEEELIRFVEAYEDYVALQKRLGLEKTSYGSRVDSLTRRRDDSRYYRARKALVTALRSAGDVYLTRFYQRYLSLNDSGSVFYKLTRSEDGARWAQVRRQAGIETLLDWNSSTQLDVPLSMTRALAVDGIDIFLEQDPIRQDLLGLCLPAVRKDRSETGIQFRLTPTADENGSVSIGYAPDAEISLPFRAGRSGSLRIAWNGRRAVVENQIRGTEVGRIRLPHSQLTPWEPASRMAEGFTRRAWIAFQSALAANAWTRAFGTPSPVFEQSLHKRSPREELNRRAFVSLAAHLEAENPKFDRAGFFREVRAGEADLAHGAVALVWNKRHFFYRQMSGDAELSGRVFPVDLGVPVARIAFEKLTDENLDDGSLRVWLGADDEQHRRGVERLLNGAVFAKSRQELVPELRRSLETFKSDLPQYRAVRDRIRSDEDLVVKAVRLDTPPQPVTLDMDYREELVRQPADRNREIYPFQSAPRVHLILEAGPAGARQEFAVDADITWEFDAVRAKILNRRVFASPSRHYLQSGYVFDGAFPDTDPEKFYDFAVQCGIGHSIRVAAKPVWVRSVTFRAGRLSVDATDEASPIRRMTAEGIAVNDQDAARWAAGILRHLADERRKNRLIDAQGLARDLEQLTFLERKASESAARMALEDRNRAIIDRFDAIRDTPKAVDIGSSDMEFARESKLKGWHPQAAVIGYDLPPADLLDLNLAEVPEGLVLRSAADTGLSAGSVDRVTINMPSPPDLEELMPLILPEAARILKPDGRVMITVQAPQAAEDRKDWHNLAVIRQALTNAGFEIQIDAEPLSQADPSYPETTYMFLTRKNGHEVVLFSAAPRMASGLPRINAQLLYSRMVELFTDPHAKVYPVSDASGPEMHLAKFRLRFDANSFKIISVETPSAVSYPTPSDEGRMIIEVLFTETGHEIQSHRLTAGQLKPAASRVMEETFRLFREEPSGGRMAVLDASNVLSADPDFLEALEYFNTEVIAPDAAGRIPPMTWEDAMRLYELFRGDWKNPDYAASDAGSLRRAFGDDRRAQRLLKSTNAILLDRLEEDTVIDRAANIYEQLARDGASGGQMLDGQPGFDRTLPFAKTSRVSDTPAAASGHHRLAWFMMNFFLIRNGYRPFYFLSGSDYRKVVVPPSEERRSNGSLTVLRRYLRNQLTPARMAGWVDMNAVARNFDNRLWRRDMTEAAEILLRAYVDLLESGQLDTEAVERKRLSTLIGRWDLAMEEHQIPAEGLLKRITKMLSVIPIDVHPKTRNEVKALLGDIASSRQMEEGARMSGPASAAVIQSENTSEFWKQRGYAAEVDARLLPAATGQSWLIGSDSNGVLVTVDRTAENGHFLHLSLREPHEDRALRVRVVTSGESIEIRDHREAIAVVRYMPMGDRPFVMISRPSSVFFAGDTDLALRKSPRWQMSAERIAEELSLIWKKGGDRTGRARIFRYQKDGSVKSELAWIQSLDPEARVLGFNNEKIPYRDLLRVVPEIELARSYIVHVGETLIEDNQLVTVRYRDIANATVWFDITDGTEANTFRMVRVAEDEPFQMNSGKFLHVRPDVLMKDEAEGKAMGLRMSFSGPRKLGAHISHKEGWLFEHQHLVRWKMDSEEIGKALNQAAQRLDGHTGKIRLYFEQGGDLKHVTGWVTGLDADKVRLFNKAHGDIEMAVPGILRAVAELKPEEVGGARMTDLKFEVDDAAHRRLPMVDPGEDHQYYWTEIPIDVNRGNNRKAFQTLLSNAGLKPVAALELLEPRIIFAQNPGEAEEPIYAALVFSMLPGIPAEKLEKFRRHGFVLHQIGVIDFRKFSEDEGTRHLYDDYQQASIRAMEVPAGTAMMAHKSVVAHGVILEHDTDRGIISIRYLDNSGGHAMTLEPVGGEYGRSKQFVLHAPLSKGQIEVAVHEYFGLIDDASIRGKYVVRVVIGEESENAEFVSNDPRDRAKIVDMGSLITAHYEDRMDPFILNLDIEAIRLDPKKAYLLRKEGIFSVHDLTLRSVRELRAIEGIGSGELVKITEFLMQTGLALRREDDGARLAVSKTPGAGPFGYASLIRGTPLEEKLVALNGGRPVTIREVTGATSLTEAILELGSSLIGVDPEEIVHAYVQYEEKDSGLLHHFVLTDRKKAFSIPAMRDIIQREGLVIHQTLFTIRMVEDRREQNLHFEEVAIGHQEDQEELRTRGYMKDVFRRQERALRERYPLWTLSVHPIHHATQRFSARFKRLSGAPARRRMFDLLRRADPKGYPDEKVVPKFYRIYPSRLEAPVRGSAELESDPALMRTAIATQMLLVRPEGRLAGDDAAALRILRDAFGSADPALKSFAAFMALSTGESALEPSARQWLAENFRSSDPLLGGISAAAFQFLKKKKKIELKADEAERLAKAVRAARQVRDPLVTAMLDYIASSRSLRYVSQAAFKEEGVDRILIDGQIASNPDWDVKTRQSVARSILQAFRSLDPPSGTDDEGARMAGDSSGLQKKRGELVHGIGIYKVDPLFERFERRLKEDPKLSALEETYRKRLQPLRTDPQSFFDYLEEPRFKQARADHLHMAFAAAEFFEFDPSDILFLDALSDEDRALLHLLGYEENPSNLKGFYRLFRENGESRGYIVLWDDAEMTDFDFLLTLLHELAHDSQQFHSFRSMKNPFYRKLIEGFQHTLEKEEMIDFYQAVSSGEQSWIRACVDREFRRLFFEENPADLSVIEKIERLIDVHDAYPLDTRLTADVKAMLDGDGDQILRQLHDSGRFREFVRALHKDRFRLIDAFFAFWLYQTSPKSQLILSGFLGGLEAAGNTDWDRNVRARLVNFPTALTEAGIASDPEEEEILSIYRDPRRRNLYAELTAEYVTGRLDYSGYLQELKHRIASAGVRMADWQKLEAFFTKYPYESQILASGAIYAPTPTDALKNIFAEFERRFADSSHPDEPLKGRRYFSFGSGMMHDALVAASIYGMEVTAVELDADLSAQSEWMLHDAVQSGLIREGQIRFHAKTNAFDVDWNDPDIVYFAYSLPDSMDAENREARFERPLLEKTRNLRPGSLVAFLFTNHWRDRGFDRFQAIGQPDPQNHLFSLERGIRVSDAMKGLFLDLYSAGSRMAQPKDGSVPVEFARPFAPVRLREEVNWNPAAGEGSLAVRSESEARGLMPGWVKPFRIVAQRNEHRFLFLDLKDEEGNAFHLHLQATEPGRVRLGNDPDYVLQEAYERNELSAADRANYEVFRRKTGRVIRVWFSRTFVPWLQSRGFRSIEVRAVNDRSERFFKSLGFRSVSREYGITVMRYNLRWEMRVRSALRASDAYLAKFAWANQSWLSTFYVHERGKPATTFRNEHFQRLKQAIASSRRLASAARMAEEEDVYVLAPEESDEWKSLPRTGLRKAWQTFLSRLRSAYLNPKRSDRAIWDLLEEDIQVSLYRDGKNYRLTVTTTIDQQDENPGEPLVRDSTTEIGLADPLAPLVGELLRLPSQPSNYASAIGKLVFGIDAMDPASGARMGLTIHGSNPENQENLEYAVALLVTFDPSLQEVFEKMNITIIDESRKTRAEAHQTLVERGASKPGSHLPFEAEVPVTAFARGNEVRGEDFNFVVMVDDQFLAVIDIFSLLAYEFVGRRQSVDRILEIQTWLQSSTKPIAGVMGAVMIDPVTPATRTIDFLQDILDRRTGAELPQEAIDAMREGLEHWIWNLNGYRRQPVIDRLFVLFQHLLRNSSNRIERPFLLAALQSLEEERIIVKSPELIHPSLDSRLQQLQSPGSADEVSRLIDIYNSYLGARMSGALVPLPSPKPKDFVSPVEWGQPLNGGFFPFHFQRSYDPATNRGDWGVGDFETSMRTTDLYAELGFTVQQHLPLGWSGAFDSPYAENSSRAIDPRYISVPMLVDELERMVGEESAPIDLEPARRFLNENAERIRSLRNATDVDHAEVIRLKMDALEILWNAFRSAPGVEKTSLGQAHRRFLEAENGEWLEDHMLYVLLKEENLKRKPMNGWDWRTWEAGLRDRDPAAIRAAKERLRERIDFYSFVQFVADRQYNEMKDYSRSKGVEIAVDMPFARDGADVWIHKDTVFGLKKENGYKRLVTQGVPAESAYPAGQYWQFYPYDWSHPETQTYLKKLFQSYQKRATYVRLDHVLGYFRHYMFTEDVDDLATLGRLGLDTGLQQIRQRALERQRTAPADAAAIRAEAVKEARNLIVQTLRGLDPTTAGMPADAVDSLLDAEGSLTSEAAITIARETPAEAHGQPLPKDSPWQRRGDLVEKKVHREKPVWDFLRLTASAGAGDNGYLEYYLFEGDGPRPEDSLRLSYFKTTMPSMLSEYLRLAQEKGTIVIFETLGTVPAYIQEFVVRLSGYNYFPVMWGLHPDGDYHPSKHTSNSMATFGLHDASNIRTRWEKEMSDEEKNIALDGFFPGMPENERKRHRASLTPEVHQKLLEQVFLSKALLAIPTWFDLFGLGEEHRFNVPGVSTGQWKKRLPATIQDLLKAARGDASNPQAAEAIRMVRELSRSRERALAIRSDRLLFRSNPDVNSGVDQRRRIPADPGTDAEPFLVETYAQETVDSVRIRVTDAAGTTQTHDLFRIQNQEGLQAGIVRWAIRLRPSEPGVFQYQLVATAGSREETSAQGLLIAEAPESTGARLAIAGSFAGFEKIEWTTLDPLERNRMTRWYRSIAGEKVTGTVSLAVRDSSYVTALVTPTALVSTEGVTLTQLDTLSRPANQALSRSSKDEVILEQIKKEKKLAESAERGLAAEIDTARPVLLSIAFNAARNTSGTAEENRLALAAMRNRLGELRRIQAAHPNFYFVIDRENSRADLAEAAAREGKGIFEKAVPSDARRGHLQDDAAVSAKAGDSSLYEQRFAVGELSRIRPAVLLAAAIAQIDDLDAIPDALLEVWSDLAGETVTRPIARSIIDGTASPQIRARYAVKTSQVGFDAGEMIRYYHLSDQMADISA